MGNEETLHIETRTGGLDAAIQEVLTYQPHLIIEGGTNNRSTLLHIFRQQYPGPYKGMDLNPDIDYRSSSFTVYGNCLRLDDVGEQSEKTGAKRVALVSFNCLPALISDRINHEDRKDRRDQLGLPEIVDNITQIYGIQMHVIQGGFFSQLEYFYEMCARSGWVVQDFGEKDIIVLTRKPPILV